MSNRYGFEFTYNLLIRYKIWLPDISPTQQLKADKHAISLTNDLIKLLPLFYLELIMNL